eukprot:m.64990 g.64990  ORF g.64990 m.64990 type:complete len:102 (+) comp12038_c0_seq2:1731-2036(+)
MGKRAISQRQYKSFTQPTKPPRSQPTQTTPLSRANINLCVYVCVCVCVETNTVLPYLLRYIVTTKHLINTQRRTNMESVACMIRCCQLVHITATTDDDRLA